MNYTIFGDTSHRVLVLHCELGDKYPFLEILPGSVLITSVVALKASIYVSKIYFDLILNVHEYLPKILVVEWYG